MANVINKYTFEYREHVHTPLYQDNPSWIINPVLPACDKKYWKLENDSIVEMNLEEKLAVEEQILEDAKHKYKPKYKILQEIMNSTTINPLITLPNGQTIGDTEEIVAEKNARRLRFISALDKHASFLAVLDDPAERVDYNLAKQIMQMALDAGEITQADYDIINSTLPLMPVRI